MTTRIKPLNPIPRDVLTRAEAAAGQPVRREAQVYRTLANHPDLFVAWLGWGAQVVRGTSLTPKMRELVILRVALLCDGRYPLAQHVRIGRSVGLDDQSLSRVMGDPSIAGWDDTSSAALCAVDQLLIHRRLDDSRWAALVALHGLGGTLDVVSTVAFYRMACWLVNASRAPFDDGQDDSILRVAGRFEACESDKDSAPRFAPLALDEWPASLLEDTEGWPRFEGRPELRQAGVYSTLAHHPALFRSVGPIMAHLLRNNTLTDPQREIVIVRSCLRDRGAYPYRQHVRIAGDLGVGSATHSQLSSFTPTIDAPTDAALVAFVDELHETNDIADGTWNEIRRHLDQQAIMDVIATAGFYGLISFVLSAARTPLEPGAVQLPDLRRTTDRESRTL